MKDFEAEFKKNSNHFKYLKKNQILITMQRISIKNANDQSYDTKTFFIEKTQKKTSEETTYEESSNISILVEYNTDSPTTRGNILNINLIDTT